MAKNSLLDYSTTPDSNTDIGGIGIQGTSAVNNFDNAFRTLMSQMKSDIDYKQVLAGKNANYTVVQNDNNATHRYTAGATVSLPAASGLWAGWHYTVIAASGDLVIDPNGSETINGAATLTVTSGHTAKITCDGTGFYAIIYVDMNNILGTVSQSGGVPTGKIIERGSNANGVYVRFTDGSQWCQKFVTVSSISIGAGASQTYVLGDHAAAFATGATPFEQATYVGSNSLVATIGQENVTETSCGNGVLRNNLDASRTFAGAIGVFAIGRWL